MEPAADDTASLVERLRAGDRGCLPALFDAYRDRLHRMVELRLDARLRARLDASDLLQDAYIELAGDLASWPTAGSARSSGCGSTSPAA